MLMLNERRVKHMVKLAMYESKDGIEELKTSGFYKKDYISYNMLWSIIWMTIAYFIVLVMAVIAKMEIILDALSLKVAIQMVCYCAGVYVVLLVIYIPLTRRFYRKKHARAYHHVKHFKEGLEILEEMYEEEQANG